MLGKNVVDEKKVLGRTSGSMQGKDRGHSQYPHTLVTPEHLYIVPQMWSHGIFQTALTCIISFSNYCKYAHLILLPCNQM